MKPRTWFNVAIDGNDERPVIDRIVAMRGLRSRSDLARTLFGEEADRLNIPRAAGTFQHRTGQQNRRRITPEMRAKVHELANNGRRTSEIAELVHLPRPTVSAIRHGRDYCAQRSA